MSCSDFVQALKPLMEEAHRRTESVNALSIVRVLEQSFKHKNAEFVAELFSAQHQLAEQEFVATCLKVLFNRLKQDTSSKKSVPLPIHRYCILRVQAHQKAEVQNDDDTELLKSLHEVDELGHALTLLSLITDADGVWQFFEEHTDVLSALSHTNAMIILSRALSRFRKHFKTATPGDVNRLLKIILKLEKARAHVGGILFPQKIQHILFWCGGQLAAATEEARAEHPNAVTYLERLTTKFEKQLAEKVASLEACTSIRTLTEASDIQDALTTTSEIWESFGPYKFDVAATFVKSALRTQNDDLIKSVIGKLEGLGVVGLDDAVPLRRVQQILEKWEANTTATTAENDREMEAELQGKGADLPPGKHRRVEK
eukprot:PhM_4_TR14383/c0_g2_i1/m.60966